MRQYKKNALEYGKKLRGSYVNKSNGKTISIGKSGLQEVLQHDYKDVEQLQSIAAIPQIIEESIYIDSMPNNDTKVNAKQFDYYICGLNIGGEDYTVRAVIVEQRNGNRYYDHKLTRIEKGKLLDSLSGITNPGFNQETSHISGIKDTKLIPILQTNSSKVVDENGEPLVVYHGSPSKFFSFDTSKIGSSTGTSDGRGFYFTTDRNYAEVFGNTEGQTLDVFLNIRNPLSTEKKTITKKQLRDIIRRIDEEEFSADGEHWLMHILNCTDIRIQLESDTPGS